MISKDYCPVSRIFGCAGIWDKNWKSKKLLILILQGSIQLSLAWSNKSTATPPLLSASSLPPPTHHAEAYLRFLRMKHTKSVATLAGTDHQRLERKAIIMYKILIRDGTIADSPHSLLHLLAPLPFSHPSCWSSCQFSFHEAPRVLLLWRKLIIKDWKRELSWCVRPYMGCHRNI